MMNDYPAPVELLFEKAEDYGKLSLELFRLNTIDKSADIISSLAVRLAIFVFIGMFTLLITVGIALWIGEQLGKSYYGFFIIAGCYAIIAMLLYIFRYPWVEAPIRHTVVSQMLKQKAL